MLRDDLVGLIEPMRNSAGINPLSRCVFTSRTWHRARDPYALKIPAPKGRNLHLTESVTSPFQAEPAQISQNTFPNSLPIRTRRPCGLLWSLRVKMIRSWKRYLRRRCAQSLP